MEKEQIISDTILIKSQDLLRTKNIDGYILQYLRTNYENLCHNNGYVIPGSIELIQRSHGIITSNNGLNYIQYNINYKNKSIVPTKDDIFECVIENVTKMGVVGYLKYNDISEIKESPILFIIPNEFSSTEIDFAKGDIINVKVLDVRIKFQSTQIQVIGEYLP